MAELENMTKEQLEAQLAKVSGKETENAEHSYLVSVMDGDEVKTQSMTANPVKGKVKARFMRGVGNMFDFADYTQNKQGEDLMPTMGDVLFVDALLSDPFTDILGGVFDLEEDQIATWPNLDIVLELLTDNQGLIDGKADKLIPQLQALADKYGKESK